MKMRLREWGWAPYSGMILLVSALAAQTPVWKGRIYKDGDVTIVQNPKEPMYKGEILALKEDLRLGGPEAKNDYSFNRIQTLAVDAQENIFVLDYKEAHVKVFDKTGKYLRTIGRKGQGPGELDGPMVLAFDRPSGALLVLESGARRISCFDSQGKFIKAMSLKGVWGLGMRLDSLGNIYVMEAVLGQNEGHYLVKKFAPDLKIIAVLAQAPSLVKPTGASNPFRPIPYFQVDNKDRLLYGFPKTYEIQIFGSADKPVGRILKDYDPVEVTAEEMEEQKKDTPASIPLEFSKYHAAFRRFFPDDQGRLFIQTFQNAKTHKGHLFDVFDIDGRFQGSVPLAETPIVMKKGKLYSLEEDEDGYQIIKRYALTWKIKS
jgi:hypothetical protein